MGEWALPASQRIYYLGSVNDSPYLLIGVNPSPPVDAIHLSSFARIVPETRRLARPCLKKLVEDFLVPLARTTGRRRIRANMLNMASRHALEHLETHPPKGVLKIHVFWPIWQAEVHQ
jgi:hypothetical protein